MRLLIVGRQPLLGQLLAGTYWHEDVEVETVCSGSPDALECMRHRAPFDVIVGLQGLPEAELIAFRGLLRANAKFLEGLS